MGDRLSQPFVRRPEYCISQPKSETLIITGSRYEFVLEPFDEVIVRCRSIPSLFKIDLHKYVLKAARQWGVPPNVAAYWRMNCDKKRLHLPSHSHTSSH